MYTTAEAPTTTSAATCYHCGDPVRSDGVTHDDKAFCCPGCVAVYDILSRNDLCQYYALNAAAGQAPPAQEGDRFAYLDDPDVAARLRDFSDGTTGAASFTVPHMHCSSCIWLLENLHRIDPGILHSRVDFLRKRISVRFQERRTSLRRIVELLTSLGYEPRLTLEQQERDRKQERSLYYKVGIAGFAFANIMLLSLPEYFSGGRIDPDLRRTFTWVSLALATPVFLYSAGGYYRSAWQGLRERIVNIDVPIMLGILILFGRSVWEIGAGTGPGFLDSLTGLVFFLLVGRVFQSKTYDSLHFERSYRSYFPLAVLVRDGSGERATPVTSLRIGDRMLVRNGEIIPADAVLLQGEGAIDYSFVTGESRAVRKEPGDLIFAGGRQVGGRIELEVVKDVSQSYLTQLWNDAAFTGRTGRSLSTISTTIGKYFTAGVLALAALAGLVWFPVDPGRAMDAITGILIVACPCALAIATPFAFGTAMRIFGRNGFYLKNAEVVEALAHSNAIVLDKTGTLTETGVPSLTFAGGELTVHERVLVASLARNSHHPLSRAIAATLPADQTLPVELFVEVPNAGLKATVGGRRVRLGSRKFASAEETVEGRERDPVDEDPESRVYVAIDGRLKGWYRVAHAYRDGIEGLLRRLGQHHPVAILSGDSEGERARLEEMTGGGVPLSFNQTPAEKLAHVTALREKGGRVLMVGDGLNDAGALRAADVGVTVTDDLAAFSPACDAILDGARLASLSTFLTFSRSAVAVVMAAFGFSFLYNMAAIAVAFRGDLSPVLAAILMPLSSITVVVLATGSLQALARRKGLL